MLVDDEKAATQRLYGRLRMICEQIYPFILKVDPTSVRSASEVIRGESWTA